MFKKNLSETFALFSQEFYTLSAAMLIIWFPANVFINWYLLYEIGTLESIRFVNKISEALYPLVVGTVTYIAYCSRRGRPCTAFDAIGRGAQLYWPIIKANFIAGLKILAGIVLLIVPGVYLATRYSLINAVVVVEGEQRWLPRARSHALTRGHAWPIFFTGAFLFGGNMVLRILAATYEIQSDNLMILLGNSIRETVFDLLGSLVIIAMFLYYWNIKEDSVARGDEKIDFDPDSDFEESKSRQPDALGAHSSRQ